MKGSFENCSTFTRSYLENILSNSYELLEMGSIINILLNTILTITATLGNGLIIVAILRSPNLQTPSYLLITSLAFTDLLVGLVFHPLQIISSTYFLLGIMRGLCFLVTLVVVFAVGFGGMSLLMVTCISIDRYLALTLRHRYPIIVTKKRVRFLIVFLWMFAFLLSVLNFFESLYRVIFYFELSSYLLTLITTCVFYIKSFRALHLYTVQVHAQQANPLAGNFDVDRYKKTLKTMLVVLACLLLCYLPLGLALVLRRILNNQKEILIVNVISLSLMGLSSSINPVIYLTKFADIRDACRKILRKIFHAY